MDADSGEDAAVANAANWLRLVFHALTCNNSACVLGERCIGGKQLLAHVLACEEPGVCTVASCTSVRRLTLHWLRCQDTACRLCAGVWRDLSGVNESISPAHGAGPLQHGLSYNSAPPEAPGTPDRFGLPAQLGPQTAYGPSERDASSLTSAGELARGDSEDVRVYEARHHHHHHPHPMEEEEDEEDFFFETDRAVVQLHETDRAVVQLHEATSYLRYLLHGLMCRHARDAPSRAPGLHFWLNVLLPLPVPLPPAAAPPPPPHHVAGGPPGRGGGRGGEEVPAAATGPGPAAAGRRLLTHRLTCRNPHCALCTGTCELFTRGGGLPRDVPVPSSLCDMDQIVQELSLALGSFNL